MGKITLDLSENEVQALVDWNRVQMKSCATSELYAEAARYKDRAKQLGFILAGQPEKALVNGGSDPR